MFVLLYSWSVATGIDCNKEHMSRVVCYKKLERCVVVMTVTKHIVVTPNPHCDYATLHAVQCNYFSKPNSVVSHGCRYRLTFGFQMESNGTC